MAAARCAFAPLSEPGFPIPPLRSIARPLGRLLSLGVTTPKAIHVVMLDRQWAVLRYGDLTPLQLFQRKQDAVNAARAIVKGEGSELVVFDLGGRPMPPTHD